MSGDDPARPPMHRREFLARSAKAGALAMTATGAAFCTHNRERTPLVRERPVRTDYHRESAEPAMAVVEGGHREALLDAALEALGGLGRFIQRGETVLIKVNAAFAAPARLGATTHPDLVSALARHCLKAGARRVVVADNPINDAQSCFALSGIGAAAERAGAQVLLPRPPLFSPISLPNGRLIRDWPFFSGALAGVDRVIGLAPVKHHNRSGASLSMKNWYGLLGGRRNLFHQDINGILCELGQLIRPTLVVLDGFHTMVSNGPTGGSLSDLRETRTLIASTDHVAADAEACRLLGLAPSDLPWIRMASAAGAGTDQPESLNPKRLSV